MSGYGSIPEADSVYAHQSIDGETTSSDPSRQARTHVSSLLSEFGLVFLGFVIGSHINWSGYHQRTVRNNRWQHLIAENVLQHASPGAINSKPFLDALPFEEIYPRQLWNSVQIPPITKPAIQPKHNSSHHKHHHDQELIETQGASKSTLSYSYLRSIFLGSASLFPMSTTTSSTNKAHILYLANEAAFSLLYDNSNPKNYYLNEYSLDYFLLTSGGFDAQINQAYCAVASVAALLNSLKYAKRFRDADAWTFDLPVDSVYDPYPYATQQDILKGECVSKTVIGHNTVDGETVYGILRPPYGLNLEQTSNLIRCHTSSSDWDVTFQEVDPSKLSLSKMRYDLKAALIDPDARVMINYDRKGLNQEGGGHYSPVGAYHAATDSFLVMDVAKYKYPPVWVGADTLFDAMATVDSCGSYDFPSAQDRLLGGDMLDPNDREEYEKALGVLGCRQKMRGYIVLNKKKS